jgi:hypothetical protein
MRELHYLFRCPNVMTTIEYERSYKRLNTEVRWIRRDCIYGFFNDAVNSSEYIASNGRTNSE